MAERSQDTHGYDNDGELILTGSSNAYVAVTARPVTGYYQGLRICGKANHTNTGAATINVNGMGAVAIRKLTSVALVAGDIVSGQYYDLVYDFTNGWFQLLSHGAGTYVEITGDTMTGPLVISASNATTDTEYLKLQPTDFGSNKPYITLKKEATAEKWSFLLWDGTDTNGTINFYSGTLTHNDVPVQVAGKQTIWVPAAALFPLTTPATAVTTFAGLTAPAIAFDPSSAEFALLTIAMPKGWDEGTITFQVYWAHPATTTNFGVSWGVFAQAYGDDDSLSDSPAGITVADTGGTTNDLYISPESSALTIAGSPSEGDLVRMAFYRDVSSGSDTLAVDAYLLGVKFFYTTNAPNDA